MLDKRQRNNHRKKVFMVPYVPQFNAADLSAMGIDTAGGVMSATAAQSGNVASLGIFGGAVMPQVSNIVGQTGMMVHSIGGPTAEAAAEKAQEDAKAMCASCQNKKAKD